MSIFLYFFLIFFEFSSNYDIIPFQNFEKKIATFNEEKDYIIYSYFIPESPKYTKYIHTMQKIYYGQGTFLQDVYVYEDLSKIEQDSNGDFINYFLKDFFFSFDCQIGFSDSFYKNKTYYFVIKNQKKLNEKINLYLSIFSTEATANLNDFIQIDTKCYSKGTFNYKFHIPSEHKKYILFEIRTNMMANITLKDNNQSIVSKNCSFLGEGHLELKEGYSYNIDLSFVGNGSYKNGEIYFYFVQSKYIKFFPVVMDTEYFQRLYFNRKLKLLLDLSSIKKGDMIWVENIRYLGWMNIFKLKSYDTDDEKIIEKTIGKEIKLSYDDKCEDNICKNYIHKDSDDIKTIIFEIPYNPQEKADYFDIKCGNPEKYRVRTVFISLIIGFALSIPNLIVHMIKWAKDEYCKCHYKCALFTDIILHMAYGCLFSVAFYLGAKSSLIIGFCFLGIFCFIISINIYCYKKENASIFNGLTFLLIKFKNYRTFEKAFNERRKLPPQIILTNKAKFDEDDNKENNNKIEYEYGSWEDDTNFILNANNLVLSCHFSYTINLDNETRDDLANYKNDLVNKEAEVSNDNIELKNEIYYEHLLVPNFNDNEICILNPANSKDKFLIFLWFLLLLTGYLDIYELFIHYKVEEINVRIIKKVSKKKKYRANYKLNDKKYEDNNILEIEPIEKEDIKNEPFLINNED